MLDDDPHTLQSVYKVHQINRSQFEPPYNQNPNREMLTGGMSYMIARWYGMTSAADVTRVESTLQHL